MNPSRSRPLYIAPLYIAFAFLCLAGAVPGNAQSGTPSFKYTVSIPDPSTHSYHVDLHTSGWDREEGRGFTDAEFQQSAIFIKWQQGVQQASCSRFRVRIPSLSSGIPESGNQ
jgi:hypothetical protein